MRILVIGAGATGGYFGGRLAQAGRDVTFLVRPARAAELREKGLRILSPHGDVTLAPQLVTSDTIEAPFDVVLLTVKAYALDSALQDMSSAIGPETMILPVLNGMRHIDLLARRFFGPQNLVGCVCKVASVVQEDGSIRHLNRLHQLIYGEMDGSLSPRIQQLHAIFSGAGFNTHLSDAITTELWKKWVILASLGAITCLMRGHTGEVAAAPGGTTFARNVVQEIAQIAAASGYPMGEAFVAEAQANLTAPQSVQTSSMFRDLQQGRPIEADQIIGDLIARAQQLKVATPLLETVYANLCVYQSRLAAA